MAGPSKATEQAQLGLQQRQQSVAEDANKRASELYGVSFPGIKLAENYYQKLASGDPGEIARAIGPATGEIKAQTAQVKQNIDNNTPRGGEQKIAKDMADINAAGNIGKLATQAYTSAAPALAQLGSSGVGLSTNQIANAISSYSGAGQTLGNVAQEQNAGKAAMMQGLGGLASGAGGIIGAIPWLGGE